MNYDDVMKSLRTPVQRSTGRVMGPGVHMAAGLAGLGAGLMDSNMRQRFNAAQGGYGDLYRLSSYPRAIEEQHQPFETNEGVDPDIVMSMIQAQRLMSRARSKRRPTQQIQGGGIQDGNEPL